MGQSIDHDAGASPWRFGIGARLILAFVAIVGLAVGACLVGWLSYERLSGELSRIAEDQMPQLAFASRLSKAGADIGSVTTVLAGAETRAEYNEIRSSYAARLTTLRALLKESGTKSDATDLLPLAEAIGENLDKIDLAAGKRFTLREAMRSDIDELRWVQADLLEEADPLVDDIRFNIEAETRNGHGAAALAEQQKSEALLTAVSQANLATGLIGRLVNATTQEEIQETNAFLGDSADDLASRIASLENWPDSITVRQLARRILDQSDVSTGIPNRKRSEMIEAAKLSELAAQNGRLVDDLGRRIETKVVAIEASAAAAAQRAATAIETGRSLLLAIAILSVLLATAIGFFYVYRNLLARIRLLSAAAGAISSGRPATAIPAPEADELGDLAHALVLFRQTRDELIQSAKLAALGQMAAGIGHELNQPLAALRAHIHSATTLIGRGKGEQAVTNLDKMKGLTGRMADQISHIRRFARRPDAQLRPVDLTAAVRDAFSLLEHRFEEEAVEMQLRLPEDASVLVMAEPVRLEQVAVNLIGNALDAVKGRPKRRVHATIEQVGADARLVVGDTGSGIAADDVAAVFDPFFTTKPVGSGLGLGLSISYNIVKDFGGEISILETSAHGTQFLVSLKGPQ
ncbi:C4-dicarboxylate transport sensor protein DctB [Ensifer sp. M14]|uniref:ATP-binding protein n=1 Tax=Ensifer sp. M14 TaxID=2203782 RepID=UPI000E1DEC91|nr:ATP-binding protein [Ensifer sp. M14]RDL48177.1 C4-dicarboxylate transport sensor protein DctB [Ensifer sp. M14]